MKSHRPYLIEWWTIFSAVTVALIIVYLQGMFEVVNDADMTKLGFAILILFYLATLRNGSFIFRMDRLTPDQIEHKNELNWFVADVMPMLGMIGTVVGFIYLFSGAFSESAAGTEFDIKSIIPIIAKGSGTALYTTVIGLIFRILLRVQAFSVRRYLNARRQECP